MNTVSLKKYIFDNRKIEFVLQQLGCRNIRYNATNGYYSASFPDGDNPKGVNISDNQYLDYWSWSRNVAISDSKDVFDLIQYIEKTSFVDSVKRLHKILGIEYSPYKKQMRENDEKPNPLWVFRRHLECNRRINVDDVRTIEEEALNDYVPLLHIDWLRDGVAPWTRDKFDVMYSYKRKRVVLPHRYWMTGKLFGFNMRSTLPNCEELGIPKYILTTGMDKSINLYGLYENYNAIQEAGYVVVVEGERSVLKRDSLCDCTCVALSGKTISEEQRRILIGLNVEIILCLDNDVDINQIWHECDKMWLTRKVSYIKDAYGLLGEKDSPCDSKDNIYKHLFKWRIPYTESEHKEYLKSLGK